MSFCEQNGWVQRNISTQEHSMLAIEHSAMAASSANRFAQFFFSFLSSSSGKWKEDWVGLGLESSLLQTRAPLSFEK